MQFHSHTMTLQSKNGVSFLTYPALSAFPFMKHAFSTRLGGVSTGDFATMNLSFGRGDPDENVLENYRRFCTAAGFDFQSLTASAQDHHTYVRCITEKEKGIGITKPRDMQSVDGLVTNQKGITLVTYYADCTPLFFADPVKKVVALAHAGWRGTAGGIGKQAIATMQSKYGCNPADIIAAVGPAIGSCCYEVDEDCCRYFLAMEALDTARFVFPKGGGKYMLDLLEANRQILLKAGVMQAHITVSDVCTCCNSQLLWSHRATHGKRGGMAAFICIK